MNIQYCILIKYWVLDLTKDYPEVFVIFLNKKYILSLNNKTYIEIYIVCYDGSRFK